MVSDGFAKEKDLNLMDEFQENNDWKKKNDIVAKLEDQRFKYFGKRLIYQNQPEVLNKNEYKENERYIC